MRTASAHLCQQWIGPACAATTVFGVIGWVGLVAVHLLRAPALPPAEGLARVALASLPVLGEWILPLGVLAGLTGLLARWRSEGEWLALRATGTAGRRLVPAVLAVGVALAAATAGLTHQGAPWGRAVIVDVLTRTVSPLPGRATALGGLTVLPGGTGDDGLTDLLLAWEGPDGVVVAAAEQGRLAVGSGLVLEWGAVLGPAGELSFDRLQVPLPPSAQRPPPSAWPGPELRASVDPYHRAIGHKRAVWPLATVLLVLLAVPGVLSGWGWTVPLSVVGWWALVRTCDGLAPLLGGLASALLPLVVLAGVAALAWQRWADR